MTRGGISHIIPPIAVTRYMKKRLAVCAVLVSVVFFRFRIIIIKSPVITRNLYLNSSVEAYRFSFRNRYTKKGIKRLSSPFHEITSSIIVRMLKSRERSTIFTFLILLNRRKKLLHTE